ncbi:MAG: trans-sulfuration enzyme family protein [Anaerovoracaceae bacterium]|jgi:methionine-gamma-lyase
MAISEKEFSQLGYTTQLLHSGTVRDTGFDSMNIPIYQTSNFRLGTAENGGALFAGEKEGYTYTTFGNPTVRLLEEKIAALEHADDAVCTGSGMAAIATTLWCTASAGKHIVADTTLFGDSFGLLKNVFDARYGIDVDFVDFNDPDALKSALRDNTCCVYFESPSNPTMKIVDIKKVSDLVHGFNSDIKVIIDNTFATPYLQQPLDLGADVVVHSTTKYLNGHGDVIGGAICTNDADWMQYVRTIGMTALNGGQLDPFAAFLIIRGLKTFSLRMERHCANARRVAEYLDNEPKCKKVYFPGLKTHPNHDVAARQMKDFGGMISFELYKREDGPKLLDNLKVLPVAISLGDVETLLEQPATMTHKAYTKEALEEAGIPEGLVRMSVGLEDVEDIIGDLQQAFEKV